MISLEKWTSPSRRDQVRGHHSIHEIIPDVRLLDQVNGIQVDQDWINSGHYRVLK